LYQPQNSREKGGAHQQRGRTFQQQRPHLIHLPQQQIEEGRSSYTPHSRLEEGRTTRNPQKEPQPHHTSSATANKRGRTKETIHQQRGTAATSGKFNSKGRSKKTPAEEGRSKERIRSLQRQKDNDVCSEG